MFRRPSTFGAGVPESQQQPHKRFNPGMKPKCNFSGANSTASSSSAVGSSRSHAQHHHATTSHNAATAYNAAKNSFGHHNKTAVSSITARHFDTSSSSSVQPVQHNEAPRLSSTNNATNLLMIDASGAHHRPHHYQQQHHHHHLQQQAPMYQYGKHSAVSSSSATTSSCAPLASGIDHPQLHHTSQNQQLLSTSTSACSKAAPGGSSNSSSSADLLAVMMMLGSPTSTSTSEPDQQQQQQQQQQLIGNRDHARNKMFQMNDSSTNDNNNNASLRGSIKHVGWLEGSREDDVAKNTNLKQHHASSFAKTSNNQDLSYSYNATVAAAIVSPSPSSTDFQTATSTSAVAGPTVVAGGSTTRIADGSTHDGISSSSGGAIAVTAFDEEMSCSSASIIAEADLLTAAPSTFNTSGNNQDGLRVVGQKNHHHLHHQHHQQQKKHRHSSSNRNSIVMNINDRHHHQKSSFDKEISSGLVDTCYDFDPVMQQLSSTNRHQEAEEEVRAVDTPSNAFVARTTHERASGAAAAGLLSSSSGSSSYAPFSNTSHYHLQQQHQQQQPLWLSFSSKRKKQLDVPEQQGSHPYKPSELSLISPTDENFPNSGVQHQNSMTAVSSVEANNNGNATQLPLLNQSDVASSENNNLQRNSYHQRTGSLSRASTLRPSSSSTPKHQELFSPDSFDNNNPKMVPSSSNIHVDVIGSQTDLHRRDNEPSCLARCWDTSCGCKRSSYWLAPRVCICLVVWSGAAMLFGGLVLFLQGRFIDARIFVPISTGLMGTGGGLLFMGFMLCIRGYLAVKVPSPKKQARNSKGKDGQVSRTGSVRSTAGALPNESSTLKVGAESKEDTLPHRPSSIKTTNLPQQIANRSIGWAITTSDHPTESEQLPKSQPSGDQSPVVTPRPLRRPITPQSSLVDSLSANSLAANQQQQHSQSQQQLRQSSGIIKLPSSSTIVIQNPSGAASGCCLHQNTYHCHSKHLECRHCSEHSRSLCDVANASTTSDDELQRISGKKHGQSHSRGHSPHHRRSNHPRRNPHREVYVTELSSIEHLGLIDGSMKEVAGGRKKAQQVVVVSGWQPTSATTLVTTQSCKELADAGTNQYNQSANFYQNLPNPNHRQLVVSQEKEECCDSECECSIYQTLPANWPPPPPPAIIAAMNTPPKPAARLSLLKRDGSAERRRQCSHEEQQISSPECSPHCPLKTTTTQQVEMVSVESVEPGAAPDQQSHRIVVNSYTVKQKTIGPSKKGSTKEAESNDANKAGTGNSPQRRVLFVPRGPLPQGGPDDLLHQAFLVATERSSAHCSNINCPKKMLKNDLSINQSSSPSKQHRYQVGAASDKEDLIGFSQPLWTSRSFGDLLKQTNSRSEPCRGCTPKNPSAVSPHMGESDQSKQGLLVAVPGENNQHRKSAFSPAGGHGYPPSSSNQQTQMQSQPSNTRPHALFMSDPASERLVSVRLTRAVKLGLDEGISSSDWSRWDCLQQDQQAAALDRQNLQYPSSSSGRYHHFLTRNATPPDTNLTSSSECLNIEPTAMTSETMLNARARSHSRGSGCQLRRQDATLTRDSLENSAQEDGSPNKRDPSRGRGSSNAAPSLPPPYSWTKHGDNA